VIAMNLVILSAAKDLLLAHAQGCTQCLDSTRATPPAVQAAYRHAIYLLAAFGATIFTTGTLLMHRKR
jgi:hypothetical protein